MATGTGSGGGNARRRMTAEEREAIAREAERAKESDEIKTLRRLVREELDEWFDERFESGSPEGEGEGAGAGGGGIIEGLFGGSKRR